MTRSRVKIAGTFLLASYLSCFVLAEFFHGHHTAKAFSRGMSVTSHTCGDVELHRPLDWLGQCALCRDGHGRTLAIAQFSPQDGLAVNPLDVPLTPDEHPTLDACKRAGITRGPPAI